MSAGCSSTKFTTNAALTMRRNARIVRWNAGIVRWATIWKRRRGRGSAIRMRGWGNWVWWWNGSGIVGLWGWWVATTRVAALNLRWDPARWTALRPSATTTQRWITPEGLRSSTLRREAAGGTGRRVHTLLRCSSLRLLALFSGLASLSCLSLLFRDGGSVAQSGRGHEGKKGCGLHGGRGEDRSNKVVTSE